MNTTEQTLDYQVEKLTAAKLADVAQLHAAVYGAIPSADFFPKKYNTAFTGVEYVGYVAYNAQRIPVGFYAVIPCFMQFGDKPVLAAQSADTMTHPGYRYKGLFVELSNMTFQLCRDLGINLVFGFPNQNSLPGAINKLGWQMTHQLDCFIIPVTPLLLRRALNKLPYFKNRVSHRRKKVLAKYAVKQNIIDNSVVKDGFAGVLRNDDYSRYKVYNESHVIRIGQSLIWIKISHILLIGDMTIQAGEFDQAITGIKKLAKKLSIKEIHFHASPGTGLHSLFAAGCQSIPSFYALFQDFDKQHPIENIRFTSADIDTF